MTTTKTLDGTKLTIAVEGRLDTVSAPVLEAEINENIAGITELVIDIADLAYISSAGLRVLLSAQKIMNKQGSMKVCNVSSEIYEIFEVTGFNDILTIQ